jgi:hypothetical protein
MSITISSSSFSFHPFYNSRVAYLIIFASYQSQSLHQSFKMQFSQATVVAFLAATTVAGHVPPEKDHHTGASNTTWVTTTVSNYVTYCPESTAFEVGNHTYTAT